MERSFSAVESAPIIVNHRPSAQARAVAHTRSMSTLRPANKVEPRKPRKSAAAAARVLYQQMCRQERLRRKQMVQRKASAAKLDDKKIVTGPSDRAVRTPHGEATAGARVEASTVSTHPPVKNITFEQAVEDLTFAPKRPSPSEGKKKDFGYGMPRWSPYWNPRDFKPAPVAPTNTSYGAFSTPSNASHTQSPEMQLHSNIRTIREMKCWAIVDHTWELFGSRPTWANDLDFIEITGQLPSKRADVTLSEDKKRDYGYGVPLWSPYHRPRGS